MGLVGWIILAAVVLLLLYAIGIYNKLVRLRALVREAFSGITVQLRRRADLIPNLVETVRATPRTSARPSTRSLLIAPMQPRPSASMRPPKLMRQ